MRNVDHTILNSDFSLSKETIKPTDAAVRTSISICAATRESVFYIISNLTVQIYAPKNAFAFGQPEANESVGKDDQSFCHGNNP